RDGGRGDGRGASPGRGLAREPVGACLRRRTGVHPARTRPGPLADPGRSRERDPRAWRCPRFRGPAPARRLPRAFDGPGGRRRARRGAPDELSDGRVREAGPPSDREVPAGGSGRRRHPERAVGAGCGRVAGRRRRRREDRADAVRLSRLASVLIANRGEGARRVLRACRAAGVRSIAVCSEADAGWPHVTDADEAVLIGPAPARESYLDPQRILTAARERGAQAVHPGYGFLSENWRFAKACEEAGLIWIGPTW